MSPVDAPATDADLAATVRDVTAINARDTARYGGKAAGLARMHGLGLPVPPAFVIDTTACAAYQRHGQVLPPPLLEAVATALGGSRPKPASASAPRAARRPGARTGARCWCPCAPGPR